MHVGKLPLTVTVSAAVHAVVVAWVGTRDIEIDHAPPPAPVVTTVELVETPPLEVAMATESQPATSQTSAVDVTRGDNTRGDNPAHSDKPTGGEAGGDEPGSERPGRSRYLDMRRGTPRVDLSLPATRDDLDNAPAGTAPQKPETDRGAHKSEHGSFVAKVDKDGDVKMEDRSDMSIRWAVPTPKIIGRGIAEWYESDKGEDGQRGKQTLAGEVGGSIDNGGGAPDGTDKGDRSKAVIIPVFRGGFNPTDWLMRRTVGDPYASKKRAYLDATRDERAQIRAHHRTEQLARTSIIMRDNLERAWASTTDVAQRKQLLFELWDEVVEPADEESAIAEASRAARTQVIGFIRARLPQRGAHAYTRDEIAALNARKQSIETFAPYD